MRKISRNILCVILILVMALTLCACKADPNCGVYVADSVEIGDYTFDISAAYEEGASFDLQEAAACTVTLDGKAYEGTWSSEGNKVSIVIEEEESEGTIADGVLSIDLYKKGMTMVCPKQ